MTADHSISTLRDALAEARANLLDAMTGLTERDFASTFEAGAIDDPELNATTVVGLLAAVVASEYGAVRRARAAVPAIEPRPARSASGEPPARILPPQVVHGLAGARHETSVLLEHIETLSNPRATLDSPVARADDQPETTVHSLLEAIARRENQAAQRIRSRPSR